MKDIIKIQREKLKLTYEEIGKYVGVSKSTVKKWETGYIANMRRDKIQKLAEILSVTPAYFMGWDEETNNSTDFRLYIDLTPEEQNLITQWRKLPREEQLRF